MEKKENVFSKILNKIKAFSNKYLEQDIIEPTNELTPIEEKELRGIESVGKEVHENGFTVTLEQVTIDENAARNAAVAKAKAGRNNKNFGLQK